MANCIDVDDQKRSKAALDFLGGASAILASSLDHEATIAAVAAATIPLMADRCDIEIHEPDGTIRRLAASRPEPGRPGASWERSPLDPAATAECHPARRAIDAGRPDVGPVPAEGGATRTGTARRNRSGRTSRISVPLAAGGQTLGAIGLTMEESGRSFDPADLPVLKDLGRRVGLALDNASLYREARRAREAAEAASLAKDRFLAILSHELRTPLTPILAEISALLGDPSASVSGPLRGVLEMTRRNVDLQVRLIDDILDVSRIGQGKLRLDRRRVDVHEVFSEAIAICRASIDEAGLRIVTDLGATRHHAQADPA